MNDLSKVFLSQRRLGGRYQDDDTSWRFFSITLSLAVLVFASLGLAAFLLVVIQPNSLTQTAIVALILESRGLTFLFNWLPIVLLMLLLYFATGRLALSCGLSGFLFIGFALANRFMIEMRHAPLRPLDLRLGMEFLGVAHSLQLGFFLMLGFGTLGYIALMIFAIWLIKNKSPSLFVRLGGSFASLIIFVLLFIFIYGDSDRYESLPMSGSQFNAVHQFQSKGFVYSFIHAMHHSRIVRPEYFDMFRDQIIAHEELPIHVLEPDNLPHIIMILSEAFSEMPLSPYINFDGLPHPMYHYLAIREESIHGHIIVPNIGGGTADTEFDILTGLNSRQFRGVPYAFTMVTRAFPSIAHVLNQAGYRSLAMHPGAAWFYNRQNVYLHLGFEAFLCDRYFDITQQRGGYISEEHTIDRILEEFRNHLDSSPEVPLFLKAITIQNHGPYYGKYEDVEVNFNFSSEIPYSERLAHSDVMAVSNYFHGMFDKDEGLRRLVEYFRALDEPVILIYYGDHLPSFPLAIYEALIPETDPLLHFNELPFIIWANFPLAEADYGFGSSISAHYLGAIVLSYAGVFDHFFDFLHVVRRQFPIILERSFFDPYGEMHVFADLSDLSHPDLALYKSWAYYRASR